jgi:hypothetical protein
MKSWAERPIEIRNLFNPAFCALVLYRALQGFEEERAEGMPFSLALLVLPLSLHVTSRETLSSRSRTYLLKVVEDSPELLVGFAERARHMLPFAFEGLAYLLQYGCILVGQRGELLADTGKVRKTLSGGAEVVSCQRVARYLGREFGRIGDRVTIYTSLGVRP